MKSTIYRRMKWIEDRRIHSADDIITRWSFRFGEKWKSLIKVPMKICEKNLTHVGFLKFLGDRKAISEKISSILVPFF